MKLLSWIADIIQLEPPVTPLVTETSDNEKNEKLIDVEDCKEDTHERPKTISKRPTTKETEKPTDVQYSHREDMRQLQSVFEQLAAPATDKTTEVDTTEDSLQASLHHQERKCNYTEDDCVYWPFYDSDKALDVLENIEWCCAKYTPPEPLRSKTWCCLKWRGVSLRSFVATYKEKLRLHHEEALKNNGEDSCLSRAHEVQGSECLKCCPGYDEERVLESMVNTNHCWQAPRWRALREQRYPKPSAA